MSRVWLRAAALALAAIGAVAGLTVYYSSDKVPRCLVSGVDTWRPPADGGTYRYEVVLLDGSACVFDMSQKHRLVDLVGNGAHLDRRDTGQPRRT